ncbi:MAG: tetratricopeptide repeat protein [Bacteroidetes bacterium]|nr:tetratricopeptide repeat protein [Bacteroidota bacterium]
MAKQDVNKAQGSKSAVKVSMREPDKKQLFIMALIVAVLGFMLYSNTFHHLYVLDDYPTIKENKLTKKGLAGIPEIVKNSYWYGNDGKNDMFYRPLSVVMFAVEWEFWPDNPMAGHVINVILYALTGFLLFFTLRKLFIGQSVLLPFAASLLFIAHPLHTEVVANIKSRDEIMTFLFFLSSIYTLLDYARKGTVLSLVVSLISFFLALTSKESAIIFLFVFPLALFYYTDLTIKKNAITMAWFVAVASVYMIIRASVLDNQLLGDVVSIIDNTVVKCDYPHRFATAMVIIGTYIKLLIFPHPLVYDYSYATFKIVGLDNIWALLSILIYAGIGYYMLKNFLKKDTIVFSLVVYILPVILVSNIFFLTRSTAAERMLYLPSLGFVIILVILLARFLKTDIIKSNFSNVSSLIKNNAKLFGVIGVLLLAYSYKSYTRAAVWKNNMSLFKTDLEYIPNSARAQYSYANDLTQNLVKDSIRTAAEQEKAYNEAMTGLNKALQIHEGYFEPYFALGQLASYKKDYVKSIELYKKAMSYNREYHFLYNNIGNNYFRLNQFDTAMKYLNIAITMHPDYAEAYSNIGSVYFTRGMQKEAIESYNKAIEYDPKYYDAYKNMGSAYGILKDYNKAMEYFFKAMKIKSNDPDLYTFIGMTYGFMGDAANAKTYNDKAAELRQARGN